MFKKLKEKLAKQALKFAKAQLKNEVDDFVFDQFMNRFKGNIAVQVENGGTFAVHNRAAVTGYSMNDGRVSILVKLTRKP